ncbi:diaminopimelate epimerase [Labrys neptuniae]
MLLPDFLVKPVPAGLEGLKPFVKMHGLRNHFVIFDQRVQPRALPVADIVRLCDVEAGIGAEQVLTIEAPTPAGQEGGSYARLRIFNIDGREAGACGNATRCIAHILFEESGLEHLVLETGGGLLACRRAGPMEVSVTLGPIAMGWAQIPLSHEVDTRHLPLVSGPLRDGLALNIGNPHAVFFVDDLDAVDVRAVAPAIQNDPLFPEGVNVGVAQMVDRATLRLKVWERPGILTQACGTGACVAAYAGRLRGLVDGDRVTVHLLGGTLSIELLPEGRAIMTGPVALCCVGYA